MQERAMPKIPQRSFRSFFSNLCINWISRFIGAKGDELSHYIAVCLRNKYIAFSCQNENFKKVSRWAPSETTFAEDFSKRTFLKDALKYLTPKQRTVITLKYIYDYSDAEIALNLNISRQAVNRIKNRAIEVLREYLL